MKSILRKQNLREYDFRLLIGSSKIDFDSTKDRTNREKHKYSLAEALSVFSSALLLMNDLVSSDPYERNGEFRHNHMATYKGRAVLIVTTMRPNETVRVISMRPASRKDRDLFAQLKTVFHTPFR